MSWKEKANLGVSHFKAGRHEEAVACFTQAIETEGGSSQYILYDSRGSAYEQLGRPKEALLDAKATIKLAPDQWHGYARSARLFSQVGKLDASLRMADFALARIKPDQAKRRVEMERLKEEVMEKMNTPASKQGSQQKMRARAAGSLNPEARRSSKMRKEYIATLPIELLSDIFEAVIEVDSTNLITLLHVCRSWRAIVESTPSLWHTLILTQRSPRRKLRRWIQHSGGRIRHLQVNSTASRHLDWPFEELKHIRWTELQTMVSEDWNIFGEKSAFKSSPTNLQEFILGSPKLENRAFHYRQGSKSMYTILGSSPSFHSLTVYDMILDCELMATRFTNLTQLHIYGGDLRGTHFILPVLAANPRLENLLLSGPYGVPQSTESPVALEHLKTIKLAGASTARLLYFIKTPALADLEISFFLNGTHLVDHLSTQPLRLERLSISQTPTSDGSILNLIAKAPKLQHLELVDIVGVDRVLESLSAPIHASSAGPAEYHCPLLTTVNVSKNPEVKTGTVVRLVRSRLPPTPEAEPNPTAEQATTQMARITTLKLDSCERIDAQWLPWLRENVPSVSCIYASKKKAGWKR